MESYRNVPKVCAILISAKMATLHELKTVYSVSDAYYLLEIALVDKYNERKMIEWQQSQKR